VVGVEALGAWYGGLGNTWMQMVASVITMTSDIFLNWVLIDGHLGAPAMGVAGAALSTTIGAWLGFAYLAIAFARRSGGAPRGDGSRPTFAELRRVVRFGAPNGANWFLEFAAFQLFVNGPLASLGDEAVASLNVVLAISSVAFMPAFGIASAGAILAGNAIGRDRRDEVWPQVKITLACSLVWMCSIAAIYVLIPGPLLELFDSKQRSPELVEIGMTMLWISAGWQVFDATAMTLSETLRAAGDTAWTAGARLFLAWIVFTPAAFAIVELGGGPNATMAALVGYLAMLALAMAYRFRSGAWRRIELIEPALV
jgi:MATE family multidrug resistance protein